MNNVVALRTTDPAGQLQQPIAAGLAQPHTRCSTANRRSTEIASVQRTSMTMPPVPGVMVSSRARREIWRGCRRQRSGRV
jgi:hypothetical protein